MRDSGGTATLGELMGEGFEGRTQLTLEDLPKILGEKMPEMSLDRVGKYRLVNALHQRFGDGYANVPGVKHILEHFDKEMQAEAIARKNRRSRDG